MEEKVRYQYSYFIYSFTVKNYDKYIYSLLKNRSIQLELMNKEKDIELYTYFIPSIRNYFFSSMDWSDEQKKAFASMDDKMKKNILSQMGACFFTYPIENQIHGKIGDGDIFFTIDRINIICTKTKNCFLLLKTHIENVEKVEQVIDFNYKFREINTIPEKLKNYEKIRIQTTQFEEIREIKDLINEITTQEEISLPYVHSYLCVDSENWNNPNDFEKLLPIFKKYSNLQTKQSNLDLSLSSEFVLDADYIKIATSKAGTFLIASSIQSDNYTKVPFYFEKQYLYTYLIRLEQENMLNTCFEQKCKIEELEELQHVLAKDEITKDELGSKLYAKLKEIWSLTKLEKRAKDYQQILYQKEEIAKNKKWNKILTIILAISIMLNLFNLIVNLRIL